MNRTLLAAGMLVLGWLGWVGAGRIVEVARLPIGGLLVQACLFVGFLALAERLGGRFFPSDPSGDHHG